MVAASTTPFVECSLFEVRSQLECKLQTIEDSMQCLNRVVETVLARNQQEVDEGGVSTCGIADELAGGQGETHGVHE